MRQATRRGGFGLVVILVLLAVMSSLIAVIASTMQKRLWGSVSRDEALQGQYAARAGLSLSLVELRGDQNWNPGEFTGALTSNLGFKVEVLNNRTGTLPENAPDDTVVAPGYVWLRATGIVNGKEILGSSGQAKALATRPLPTFNYACETRIDGGFAGLVDSYDPLVGYPSSPPPRLQGHVKAHRGLMILGATIDGDVVPYKTNESGFYGGLEPTADDPTVIGPGTTITGAVRTDTAPFSNVVFSLPPSLESQPFAAMPPPGVVIPPGAYTCDGSDRDYIFDQGDYHLDLMTLNAGHQITKVGPGPTVLYLSGSFNSYGSINIGGRPENFRVFGLGPPAPTRQINLASNPSATQYYLVSAGFQWSWLGTPGPTKTEHFGARLGEYGLVASGDELHYDESLRGRPLEASTEWTLVNEVEL